MKSRRLLAIGIVLLAMFAVLAYNVARGNTLHVDLAVRAAVHRLATPPVTVILTAFTFVGRGYAVFPLTLVAFALFWSWGRKREAGVFLLAMSGEPPIEFGLKWAFHRPRPAAYFGLALPSSYSFPSGHALAAVLFYGAIAMLMTPLLPGGWSRIAIWLVATMMIASIGLSRIYLGVHYPTDVLGGYILGSIWLCAIASTGVMKGRQWRRG